MNCSIGESPFRNENYLKDYVLFEEIVLSYQPDVNITHLVLLRDGKYI